MAYSRQTMLQYLQVAVSPVENAEGEEERRVAEEGGTPQSVAQPVVHQAGGERSETANSKVRPDEDVPETLVSDGLLALRGGRVRTAE